MCDVSQGRVSAYAGRSTRGRARASPAPWRRAAWRAAPCRLNVTALPRAGAEPGSGVRGGRGAWGIGLSCRARVQRSLSLEDISKTTDITSCAEYTGHSCTCSPRPKNTEHCLESAVVCVASLPRHPGTGGPAAAACWPHSCMYSIVNQGFVGKLAEEASRLVHGTPRTDVGRAQRRARMRSSSADINPPSAEALPYDVARLACGVRATRDTGNCGAALRVVAASAALCALLLVSTLVAARRAAAADTGTRERCDVCSAMPKRARPTPLPKTKKVNQSIVSNSEKKMPPTRMVRMVRRVW